MREILNEIARCLSMPFKVGPQDPHTKQTILSQTRPREASANAAGGYREVK
jgi:hypothetical protein